MKLWKLICLGLGLVFVLTGCSTKEFNEGVESITGDISKVFEEGQDKSK